MTTRVRDIDILVQDPALGRFVRKSLRTPEFKKARSHLHFRDPSSRLGSSTRRPLYVISWVAQADNIHWKQLESRRKGQTYGLFLEQLGPFSAGSERLEALGILRTIRNWHVHGVHTNGDGKEFVRRLLKTLVNQDTGSRILDARLLDRELLVRSGRLDKLLVPLDMISCFRGKTIEELSDFEIDEDGSFIYWPKLDVHLGWEQFEQALDPVKALKAKQRSSSFNKRYGAAIRSFRNDRHLRQSDISGLGARQVRRIEQGECRATQTALADLAAAHDMDLDNYLNAIADRVN